MWHPCYGTVTSMTQHLGSILEDLREAHLVVAGQEHVRQGRAVAAALQQLRHVVPAPGPESVLKRAKKRTRAATALHSLGAGVSVLEKGDQYLHHRDLAETASLRVCHCILLQGFTGRVLLGRECRVSTPVYVSCATGSSQLMHLCRVRKQEAIVSGVTQQTAQVVQASQCVTCKQVRAQLLVWVCQASAYQCGWQVWPWVTPVTAYSGVGPPAV